ncbi:hypothetical protein RDMS_04930 [Deinococcus sp. RL]|uniref:hypothetical protein n=1 Tax=Deinococcus sp. RL TaxID=1489678 RepID=UPI0004DB17EA|nr:hypothetical protein [Deinococcus sp. RL]KEF34862.1 hypothetical protein RDMS_04930 [Deinococcus sp. RL]
MRGQGRGRRLAPALLGLLLLGPGAGAEPVVEGRTLRDEDGGTVRWERTFPAAWGELSVPATLGGTVYLGVGPVVYAFGSQGQTLARYDLPAPVSALDSSGGTLRVSVRGDGYEERFTLTPAPGGGGVQERVVFPPDPWVTGWLRRAAALPSAETLAEAVAADPLNPFLALREARVTRGDRPAQLRAVRRALAAELPFPAWVQLAADLDALGFPAAANVALDRARRDAAARGYDPEVRVSRRALEAYGNPSGYVGTLLAQGRLARADVWLRYLREVHPRFEGSDALYARYASLLEAQGRGGEAEEWRQFRRSLRTGTLYNLGPQAPDLVRAATRTLTLALAVALVAALLALAARAWRAQGDDLRSLGGRWRSWRRPLLRLRYAAVLYATWTERLGLAVLAAGLALALAAWGWANGTAARLQEPALNAGTYGGGWGAARLGDLGLRPGPDAALLFGLAAQLDGDDTAARLRYAQAAEDPCARNNLAVIAQARGDAPQAREGYRAALAARPDLAAAAYNLGLNPGTPGTAFQRALRPGQPRLCFPNDRSLARAVQGDLGVTLARLAREPLAAGQTLGSPRLGGAFLGALLLVGVLALSLVVPRPAGAAQQGRPALFRLAALGLPGAALLDSPWGGVLLLAWGTAAAALLPLAGVTRFAPPLNLADPAVRAAVLTLLAATYGLNTLAFVGAELRHARARRRAALAR